VRLNPPYDGPERPADPEHPNYIYGLWLGMRDAMSSKEFHANLGKLIRCAKRLNEHELDLMANLASVPWRRKRGAPGNSDRKEAIFWQYRANGSFTQAEAIAEIADQYRLTPGAAAKAYDASKCIEVFVDGRLVIGRAL
jgi:hypothetical protein